MRQLNLRKNARAMVHHPQMNERDPQRRRWRSRSGVDHGSTRVVTSELGLARAARTGRVLIAAKSELD